MSFDFIVVYMGLHWLLTRKFFEQGRRQDRVTFATGVQASLQDHYKAPYSSLNPFVWRNCFKPLGEEKQTILPPEVRQRSSSSEWEVDSQPLRHRVQEKPHILERGYRKIPSVSWESRKLSLQPTQCRELFSAPGWGVIAKVISK